MATLAVVSTDQVAPKERIPYWKDLIWQLLGRLRSEARSEGEFRGRMAHCDAGDVKLCRLSATSHRASTGTVSANHDSIASIGRRISIRSSPSLPPVEADVAAVVHPSDRAVPTCQLHQDAGTTDSG